MSANFDVETFDSATAFLARPPPRGAHCLVVDVRMPGMSGIALRDRLRADGRHSPILFITAHALEELDANLMTETVLPKPIEADDLFRAIDAAMGRSRAPPPVPRPKTRR